MATDIYISKENKIKKQDVDIFCDASQLEEFADYYVLTIGDEEQIKNLNIHMYHSDNSKKYQIKELKIKHAKY